MKFNSYTQLQTQAIPPGSNPLEQLRDIHLPEPVAFWPPAPGWWLLTLLLVAAICWLLWQWQQRRQARRYRLAAQIELDFVFSQFQQHGDQQRYLQDCNIVLRRTALSGFPRQRATIASLSGKEWYSFLDQSLDKPMFQQQFGKELFDAAYRPAGDSVDIKKFHRSATHWISHHAAV